MNSANQKLADSNEVWGDYTEAVMKPDDQKFACDVLLSLNNYPSSEDMTNIIFTRGKPIEFDYERLKAEVSPLIEEAIRTNNMVVISAALVVAAYERGLSDGRLE